jgi:UDP-3-O-[3-hydroxymyristoyl] glucosamine N-acyltransferase
MPHREWLRAMAVIPRLPELKKSISVLEKRIIELEAALDQR